MKRIASKLGFVPLIFVVLAGCSKKTPKSENPDTSNLRRIYQAFMICQDFKHRGPLDEEELKHYLGELGEKGKPEEFVISARDKHPFVIYYGNSINPEFGDTILAHEKDGADGNRFVLTQGGNVKVLSDAEFAQAKFAAKKAAKSGEQ